MTRRTAASRAHWFALALAIPLLPACGTDATSGAPDDTTHGDTPTGGADGQDAAPDAGADGPADSPQLPPDGPRAARKPTCPTNLATCVETSGTLGTATACSGARWVGVLADARGECPGADGIDAGPGTWTVGRLFDGVPVPAALQAYCTYTWTPPAGDPDLVPSTDSPFLGGFGDRLAAPGNSAFSSLTKDCHAVGGQDTAVTQPVSRLSEEAYYTAIGQVAPLPDGAGGAGDPAAIRVAVADSTPHGYDEGLAMDGRSDHGLNVGRVIRKIACPGDGGGVNCVGFVSNHLALPQVTPVRATPALGGYYGYQSQLAVSIATAVSDWKAHNAAVPAGESPHERLVINLSVGWDPAYGGNFNNNAFDTLAPPMRAVYQALRHASCQGALLVAAAGNDPGGPSPAAGPMYPAAWEKKPAPTAAQCGMLEGGGFAEDADRPVFPPAPLPGMNPAPAPYRPLVYGIAAVSHNDYPLANARKSSSGRLVALGQMAATRYEVSPGTWIQTLGMSGSSASAAAVSGAAAALWGYRPELRPYEVANYLYEQGTSLDPDGATARRAQICQSGFTCSTLPVRRLDVCAALVAACAGAPSLCFAAADAPTCTAHAKYAGQTANLDAVDAAYAATGPAIFDGALLTAKLPGLTVCGHPAARMLYRTPAFAGAYPTDPCPSRQYFSESAEPWVGPQPTTPICPECKLGTGILMSATTFPFKTGKLNVLIDSGYASSSVTNGVLEFLSASGSVQQTAYLRDLGLPATLTAGYSYQVNNVYVSPRPTSARLSFTVTDTTSLKPYSRQSVVTLY